MKRYLEGMRLYLCPLQHGDNYTSYGRHFTDDSIVKEISFMILGLMEDGDLVVDMSCGQNTFVPKVKELCRNRSIKVSFQWIHQLYFEYN